MAIAQSPLATLGYNLIAWPRTGIKPLLLLYKSANGVGSMEAYLKDLFKPDEKKSTAPPQSLPEEEMASLKGSATLTFDAQAGITMLDYLLNKLHLGKLATNLTLNASFEVTVSYLQVRKASIDLLELDKFLTTSKQEMEKFNTFKEKLEKNELYVINTVLKSTDILVKITDKNGQDVSLDATVKGIVDVNGNAARKEGNTVELTYKTDDDTPVVFAFKAQQIIYKKKRFWTGKPAKFYIREQIGDVLLSEETVKTFPLETGDTLIEL